MKRLADRRALLDLKSAWRAHERALSSGAEAPDLRVGLAATFTAEAFLPLLGGELLQRGFKVSLHNAPYNQVFQACLAPETCFEDASGLSIVVVLWRIEDLLGEELQQYTEGMGAARTDALANAEAKLDDLASAVRALRAGFGGEVLAGIPPFPMSICSHLGELAAPQAGDFHRTLAGRWRKHLDAITGIEQVDFDGLQRAFGATQSFDARKWYLYRQPFSDSFLAALANQVARLIQAKRRPPRKCIVLDCDNTLWGGVIGEDGLEGIALGDEFPGSAYRDFQSLLLHWQRQGVLLALASKNNEPDVWSVFDQHDGMLLERGDIAAWAIGWEAKSVGIEGIARQLNIGLDSLVFIDDSPLEIEEVGSAHPSVTCLLLPDDPARIVEELQDTDLFDRVSIEDEDRHRAVMFAQERERKALRSQMSREEFLESLELRVEIFEAREEHIGRCTQLINKTNQFNLTTIRRTQEEVRCLAEAADYRITAMRVRDRFGEYGLTGLAIVHIQGDVWEIDTFLVSCRVLGRGVETALMAFVCERAPEEGVPVMRAQFVPTERNAPAADFLPTCGFEQCDDGSWEATASQFPKVPNHITLE